MTATVDARRATAALEDLSRVFGDDTTAQDTGPLFSCSEADAIARTLLVGGQWAAARTWLDGHAFGCDRHGHFASSPGAVSRFLAELQKHIDADAHAEASHDADIAS